MGKQEFCCVQCCNCKTFQSTLSKKSKKFTCTLCSTAQSVLSTFAVSNNGKDIRQVVMTLNMARGEQEPATVGTIKPQVVSNEPSSAADVGNTPRPELEWAAFVDQPCPARLEQEHWEDAGDGYVTSLPEAEGGGKRRKMQREDDSGRPRQRAATKPQPSSSSFRRTGNMMTAQGSSAGQVSAAHHATQQHAQGNTAPARSTYLWGEDAHQAAADSHPARISTNTTAAQHAHAAPMPPPRRQAFSTQQHRPSSTQSHVQQQQQKQQQRPPLQQRNMAQLVAHPLQAAGMKPSASFTQQQHHQRQQQYQQHQQHQQAGRSQPGMSRNAAQHSSSLIQQQGSNVQSNISAWSDFLEQDDAGQLQQEVAADEGGQQAASGSSKWAAAAAGGSAWGGPADAWAGGGDASGGQWDDACFTTGL